MPLDKALLERIRNNDSALSSLDLRGNQIGDAGAKDLSDALKHNTTLTSHSLGVNLMGDVGAKDLSDALKYNSTLTSLNLDVNVIGAAGAKDLSDALIHNYILTSLDLDDNPIDDSQLQEIDALIERNLLMMLVRRQQFLFKIIMLARNARNPNFDSLWANLPKEIKLHVLSYLNLASVSYIGKTAKQTGQCVQFIFTHINECNVLIKDKQKIKLLEKKAVNSNYQFQFLKLSAYLEAKKLNKTSAKEQTDQADCNQPHAEGTDVIHKQLKS
jgi:hypothetical protein